MRAPTPQPDPEVQRGDPRAEPVATPTAVGTFATGQSPLGEYEVSTEAPVGSFVSGLTSEADSAPD
jgi:hypothetical protein